MTSNFAGKTHSVASRKKISKALQGRYLGEKNARWKGTEAGYDAIHKWVGVRKKRTGTCELCGVERYTEFANVSGEYRRDVEDFIEVCVPCHRWWDSVDLKCSTCGCALDERTPACRACNARHWARARKARA